ncbi:hypothetical protein [Streptomyces sp. NPDC002671]
MGRGVRHRDDYCAAAEVRYAEHGTVRPETVALREAFDLSATNRARAAADRVQRAVNDLGDNDKALRGWLREQKAAYLHLTNHADAQHALAGALDDNPFLLRPVNAAPVQIRAAVAQARAAAEFLADQLASACGSVCRRCSRTWCGATRSAPTMPSRRGRSWDCISDSSARARRSSTARARTTCGHSRRRGRR